MPRGRTSSADDTGPGLDRNVKVIGQTAQAGMRARHPDRIAPRTFGVNGRSLSHNTLPPPSSPARLADGGSNVDVIDIFVKTYGRGLPTDDRKAQSFRSHVRGRRPRFYLAVQIERSK